LDEATWLLESLCENFALGRVGWQRDITQHSE
jgi:hypothetical protein